MSTKKNTLDGALDEMIEAKYFAQQALERVNMARVVVGEAESQAIESQQAIDKAFNKLKEMSDER
tara:strand:+ start:592 stop:786 length:195 start_codon:yes stop_codon:yes gene_type:complete